MTPLIFALIITLLQTTPAQGQADAQSQARSVAESYFSMIFTGVRLTPRNPQRPLFSGLLADEYPDQYGCNDCVWVADTFYVGRIQKRGEDLYTVSVAYPKCVRVLGNFKVKERRTRFTDSVAVRNNKVITAPRNDIVGWRAFLRYNSRPGSSVSYAVRARKLLNKEFPLTRGKQ